MSEIGTNESLLVLKDIAASHDMLLGAAVAKAIESRQDYSYSITFSGSNNSGLQVGHNTGEISNLRWGSSV